MPIVFLDFLFLHLLIFIAAFVVRSGGWLRTVEVTDGNITYRPFYYHGRAIFLVLFSLLVVYLVFARLSAWYIDSWYFEAAIVLTVFAIGDFTFIAAKSPPLFTDLYQKFRVPYLVLRLLFLSVQLTRIMYYLLVVSMWALLSPTVRAKIQPHLLNPIPEIRPVATYILGDYSLAFSSKKGFVVKKQIFMFRKDIWTMTGCFSNPSDYGLNKHDPDVNLFPRVRRYNNYVKIYTDPGWYTPNYIDFKIDSIGRLQMNSYQMNTGVKEYHLCGTMYLQ